MRWTGAFALLAISFLWSSPLEAHGPVTPWIHVAQSDQQQCQPWQVRDANGNCADGPGVFRPQAGYVPAGNDVCWAECECYEGQAPAADNCAPCSYLGQVCTRQ